MERGDWVEAARWFERAWRLGNRHPVAALHLAAALARLGDPRAAELLHAVARGPSGPAGLAHAAALHRAGEIAAAAASLAAHLSEAAATPLPVVAGLAAPLAAAARLPGWLGWAEGQLVLGAADGSDLTPVAVVLRHGGIRLWPDWQAVAPGCWAAAFARGSEAITACPILLGSPLRMEAITRVEGLVAPIPGGLRGWAWHPGDPDRPPDLTALSTLPEAPRLPVATAPEPPPADHPLARPRGFSLAWPGSSDALRVLDGEGRDLAGSPLHRHPAPPPPRARVRVGRGIAALLVLEEAEAADGTALNRIAALGADCLVVVADGVLPCPALRRAAATGPVDLLSLRRRVGIGAAWNHAARRAGHRDLLLLRPGIVLPRGAADRLRAAAGPDGLAAPLSNGWTEGGYPRADGPTALDRAEAAAVAAAVLATKAEPLSGLAAGGVLYVARACFDALGGFLEGAFVSAEATLLEFARRAALAGHRTAITPAVFAWDRAPERPPTLLRDAVAARDAAVLAASRPLPASAPDLATIRRALDAARLVRALRRRPATLLVTHDEGGGVERHVRERITALAAAGQAAVLLRSRRTPGRVGLELAGAGLHHLAFHLPQEDAALLGLLQRLRLTATEVHHLHRHPPAVAGLPARLGLPYNVTLHDYALLCPRVTLVDGAGQHCGAPAPAPCERCAAAYEDTPAVAPDGVAGLRRDAARLLAGAHRVVAPSRDAASRFARLLPNLKVAVEPWEKPPRPAARPVPPPPGTPVTVCTVGAITRAKGLEVLRACIRHAASAALPLRFVVVGHTADDAGLMAAGPAFVTGPFEEAERAALIARQGAVVGFLPSVWPEPWCYALTGLLEAGLPTLCFDLGAQAERVWEAGGSVVPTGTPAPLLNARLLELAHSLTLPHYGADQVVVRSGGMVGHG